MMRLTRAVAVAAVAFAPSAGFGQPAKNPSAAPKSLLIYYGWPSLINGANGNLAAAAAQFAQYDFVVLGGGLQDAKHQDHAKTRQLIGLTKRPTQFFGYIPLGDRAGTDKCLTAKDVKAQLQGWKTMGAAGVLLDEFGFDYGVTRKRQNECVTAAHAAKLRVIANAWNPDDVYLPDKAGDKPVLAATDIYLWESYRYTEGKAVGVDDWRAKADKVAAGRKALPLSVFSVSTNKEQPKDPAERFAHQWYSAALDGHAATGWGHPNFSGDTKAPFVAPPVQGKKPAVNLGEFAGAPVVQGTTVTVPTTTGVIEVDAEKLTGRFHPKKK